MSNAFQLTGRPSNRISSTMSCRLMLGISSPPDQRFDPLPVQVLRVHHLAVVKLHRACPEGIRRIGGDARNPFARQIGQRLDILFPLVGLVFPVSLTLEEKPSVEYKPHLQVAQE